MKFWRKRGEYVTLAKSLGHDYHFRKYTSRERFVDWIDRLLKKYLVRIFAIIDQTFVTPFE